MAPVAAGLCMFVTYLGLWYVGADVFGGLPTRDPMDLAVALATGATMLAIVVVVVGVLPTVNWMLRRPASLHRVVLWGAVLGTAPFLAINVVILVVQLLTGTLSFEGAHGQFLLTARSIVFGLWLGTFSAAVFWWIGIRGIETDRLEHLCGCRPKKMIRPNLELVYLPTLNRVDPSARGDGRVWSRPRQ